MGASRFEYRFRFLLHGVLYALGFYAPWNHWLHLDVARTSWETVATWIGSHGWLGMQASFYVVLAVAILFAALGAWFRVWGSAYVGSDVVASRDMHSQSMLADGPYRRTRNPLYLGTLLHTVGLSLLMPLSGAVFAIVLIWILQVRLALAEEPFLTARFGEPYVSYKKTVPRFLPALTPLVASAGKKPHWLQSLAGELYFVGVALVLAIWGWQFNAQPLVKGVLISLGTWIVARAFLPKPVAAD